MDLCVRNNRDSTVAVYTNIFGYIYWPWLLNLIIEIVERLFLRFGKRIITVEK